MELRGGPTTVCIDNASVHAGKSRDVGVDGHSLLKIPSGCRQGPVRIAPGGLPSRLYRRIT